MSVEVVFLDAEPGKPRQIEILETAGGEWRKFTENPADDSEPITSEWLESVGFRFVNGCWKVSHKRVPLGVLVISGRLWLGQWHNGTCISDDPTRGDVRRLFAALGIELESPESA